MPIEVKTTAVTQNVVNEIKIEGRQKFKLNSGNFMISPLDSDADLYINSIYHGIENPSNIAKIKAGEYTQVNGLPTCIELYLDTDETFYIKQF